MRIVKKGITILLRVRDVSEKENKPEFDRKIKMSKTKTRAKTIRYV
jgi:hypothetical protein